MNLNMLGLGMNTHTTWEAINKGEGVSTEGKRRTDPICNYLCNYDDREFQKEAY